MFQNPQTCIGALLETIEQVTYCSCERMSPGGCSWTFAFKPLFQNTTHRFKCKIHHLNTKFINLNANRYQGGPRIPVRKCRCITRVGATHHKRYTAVLIIMIGPIAPSSSPIRSRAPCTCRGSMPTERAACHQPGAPAAAPPPSWLNRPKRWAPLFLPLRSRHTATLATDAPLMVAAVAHASAAVRSRAGSGGSPASACSWKGRRRTASRFWAVGLRSGTLPADGAKRRALAHARIAEPWVLASMSLIGGQASGETPLTGLHSLASGWTTSTKIYCFLGG